MVGFMPANGILHPGDTAVSRVVLINPGRSARLVWLGYSVEDPEGRWFDIPSNSVTLAAFEKSVQTKIWIVPSEPSPAQGEYRVVMAVWDAPPGTMGGRRLAKANKVAAFNVYLPGSLMSEPSSVWRPGQHPMGRGRLRPEQVIVSGAGFRLRLPSASCDGAEVRTSERFRYGNFSARLMVPDAPGSLSAFFLYAGVGGGNDEIDIEIYNDGSRQALLSAWLKGKKTRGSTVILPFDPRAGYHDYAIRWSAADLVFQADGVRLARWTHDFPHQAMRVFVNAWWPMWLSCEPSMATRELSVEWIKFGLAEPPH